MLQAPSIYTFKLSVYKKLPFFSFLENFPFNLELLQFWVFILSFFYTCLLTFAIRFQNSPFPGLHFKWLFLKEYCWWFYFSVLYFEFSTLEKEHEVYYQHSQQYHLSHNLSIFIWIDRQIDRSIDRQIDKIFT